MSLSHCNAASKREAFHTLYMEHIFTLPYFIITVQNHAWSTVSTLQMHVEWINESRFDFLWALKPSPTGKTSFPSELFEISKGQRTQFCWKAVSETRVHQACANKENQKWQESLGVKRKQEGPSLVPSESFGLSLWKQNVGDFPGGAVVKDSPASAGNTGSSPGPERSHMPRSN